MISNQSGNTAVHPRLLIHKQADLANAPITFCEYADGANNNAGLDTDIARGDVADAVTAMIRLSAWGSEGRSIVAAPSRPDRGAVTEIWVPAASAVDSAFYDVAATFAFGQPTAAQTRRRYRDGRGRQLPTIPLSRGS